MASGRDKKIASGNIQVLNDLHKISAGINLAALLVLFVFHRPGSKLPFFILSAPAWFAQYSLEKSGRPKYEKDHNGNSILVKSGDDIRGEGLFEYMFDIVYVTMMLDVIMIVFGTNYGWWLYAVIPAYAGFKLFNVVKPFLPFGRNKKGGQAGGEEVGAKTKGSADGVSKRQQKLQARNQKQQVRYR